MNDRLRLLALIASNEIRMFLRSKRTVVATFALPLLAWPIVSVASQLMTRAQQNSMTREVSLLLVGESAATLAAAMESDCRDHGIELTSHVLESDLRFHENRPDPDVWIREHADVVLSIQGNKLELFERFDLERSRRGADAIEQCLEVVREHRRIELLSSAVAEAPWSGLMSSEIVDTAQPGRSRRRLLGSLLPIVFLGFVLSGGSLIAFSTLAGERERGTLETLLSSSASRSEIVAGKTVAVFALALAVALVQIGNIGFWLAWVPSLAESELQSMPGPSPPPVAAALDWWTLAGAGALLVPLALLVSSLLMVLSGHARSYREAQQMFYPLLILTALPALFGAWPDRHGIPWLELLPIGNTTVAVRDLFLGDLSRFRFVFNLVFNLTLTLLVSIYTSWLLAREGAMLQRSDNLLGRSTASRALSRTLPTVAGLWLVSGWFRAAALPDSPTASGETWPAWSYAMMLASSVVMLGGARTVFPPMWRHRQRVSELAIALALGTGAGLVARVVPGFAGSWYQSNLTPASFSLALMSVVALEELFFRHALLSGPPGERAARAALSVGCFVLFAPAGFRLEAMLLGALLASVVQLRGSLGMAIVMRLAYELSPPVVEFLRLRL